MNRIVILGNGFDLAHGMPTTYSNFIKWYLTEKIIKAKPSGYEDRLLQIKPNPDYRGNRQSITYEEIKTSVHQSYEQGLNINRIGPPMLNWDGRSYSYPYSVKCLSPVFDNLIKHCRIYRWVDVETIFYETLCFTLDRKPNTREEKEKRLVTLNESMAELIQQLRTYLLTLDPPKPIEGYRKIFKSKIMASELDTVILKPHGNRYIDAFPHKTMIINFNYTSTIESYYPLVNAGLSNIEVNYIHGTLKDDDMIFGFGDELDNRYQEMEDDKAKGWFIYVKSFWYFKTSRYRQLLRFADSGDYQVVILGHSCGLSDRTMLHMLLEHERCRSVKIYYHKEEKINTDNYTETTYELARHFNNKSVMRERIVEYTQSEAMPQA